jgi:hypothetical protein
MELILGIKCRPPFLPQVHILRSLLCVPADSASLTRFYYFLKGINSVMKVCRQVYKLIKLHPTLTKLDASDDDDDDDDDDNNNNNNNSAAFT